MTYSAFLCSSHLDVNSAPRISHSLLLVEGSDIKFIAGLGRIGGDFQGPGVADQKALAQGNGIWPMVKSNM